MTPELRAKLVEDIKEARELLRAAKRFGTDVEIAAAEDSLADAKWCLRECELDAEPAFNPVVLPIDGCHY